MSFSVMILENTVSLSSCSKKQVFFVLRRSLACASCCFALLAVSLVRGQQPDDEKDDVYSLSPFQISELGLTPGGAQDVDYFRSRLEAGDVVEPKSFTAEGLFSGHDLPLGGKVDCNGLICVRAEAVMVQLLALPEANYLAQIGFESTLTAEEFKRESVNLVVVIDKSGSMSGQPLALVKDSLLKVLEHLGPQDQLSIVLYGDSAYVHMEPLLATKGNKTLMRTAIHEIQSGGVTYMEAGLRVGYDLALQTREDFSGKTRLMLFTDERPNVGKTDPDSFMGLMRAGSEDGIGLTTIGVGIHFGAELANTISAVRGGNLYYFSDAESMVERFENDFEFMITEMAYNLVLRVIAEPGLKIVGVYGLPGDLIKWDADGALVLEVETLFLSRNKGAIYLAFAGEKSGSNGGLARVNLSYVQAGKQEPSTSALVITESTGADAGLGLKRGVLLVNEYTSIHKALKLKADGELKAAAKEMQLLSGLFREVNDETLAKEKELVSKLTASLSFQAGERDYVPINSHEILPGMVGVWDLEMDPSMLPTRFREYFDLENLKPRKFVVRIWPVGYAEIYSRNSRDVFDRIALRFRENKLLLNWNGEELELSIKKAKKNLELSMEGQSQPIIATPSKLKIRDYDRASRDPVTGLPM